MAKNLITGVTPGFEFESGIAGRGVAFRLRSREVRRGRETTVRDWTLGNCMLMAAKIAAADHFDNDLVAVVGISPHTPPSFAGRVC